MTRTAQPAEAGAHGGWQNGYTWSGTGTVAWQEHRPTHLRVHEGVGEYIATAGVIELALVVPGAGYAGVFDTTWAAARPAAQRLPLAERARNWVEAHVEDEDLCVGQMAKALNMSRSSLHRNLVRSTGQPPGTFIRRVRLQRANRLLRGGARSVSEVAWSVGFVSLSGFSRAYRQQYGEPPSSVHCPPEP